MLTLAKVLRLVAVGCAVALACCALNTAVFASGRISPNLWARSGAPILEEAAKALYVTWLIRTHRVGFMVDAAISGFAVGPGFAVVENLSYFPQLSGAALAAFAARGLGTAMLHGGATEIFGIVSINRADSRIAGPYCVRTRAHRRNSRPCPLQPAPVAACHFSRLFTRNTAGSVVIHLLAQ